MSISQNQSEKFERLRRQAEELLEKYPESDSEMPSDIMELIHELKVHQTEIEIQNEELQRSQQEFSALYQKYFDLYEFAPCGYLTLDSKGFIQQINLTGTTILGLARGNIVAQKIFSNYISYPYKAYFREVLHNSARDNEKKSMELEIEPRDAASKWVRIVLQPEQNERGSIDQWHMSLMDITERKEAEKELSRLEWLLQPRRGLPPIALPEYGNLLELNTSRVILDAVGVNQLTSIVQNFLNLLETSVAVYEANGDYALGIFSSKWCRFLDTASRRLCNTDDNREALNCGKWLCHESCWSAARECMESGEPVDRECAGGIRLYAVPIHSKGKIIGTINVGYGDPPRDWPTLKELAGKYHVDVRELAQYANAYESRPPFLIENAKHQMKSAASLIGEIVERKQAEEATRQQNLVETTLRNVAQELISLSSFDDLSEMVLSAGKDLTGSRHGYVGSIDPATGNLIAHTFSRTIWETCQVPNKDFVFDQFGGLWGGFLLP